MSLPSASDLRYFSAVAAAENLSRAAERLGISQPTLSAAMQRLERSVGQPLLDRHTHGVHLTPAGQELAVNTKQILAFWEQLTHRASMAHSELSGRYTIGCHSSVALYTLPLVLPRLLSEHASLELSLSHGLSRHVTEDVISRRVDLGIVVNPVRHRDLVIRRIWRDEVRLWESPLASSTARKTLIYHPDLLQSRSLLTRLEKLRGPFARHLPTTDLEVVRCLVAAGVGVGILPGLVVRRSAVAGLQVVSDLPAEQDEVCLIYRAERKKVRSFKSLVAAFLAASTAFP